MAKKIKWLPRKKIIEEATKSDRDAILISIEHHTQIRNATAEEYEKANNSGLVSIFSFFCGLCWRHNDAAECENCPLHNEEDEDIVCCDEWENLDAALNRKDKDWEKVQRCEDVLIAKLESLL